jgi:hypothetical protein
VRGNFEKGPEFDELVLHNLRRTEMQDRIALEMQVLRVALCSPMSIRPSHDGA